MKAFLVIAAGTVVVVLATFWWLMRDTGTLDEAVVVINDHRAQLDRIVQIAQSNSNICFLETAHAADFGRKQPYVCPGGTSAKDREDYATIVRLMQEMSLERGTVHRDDKGELYQLDIYVFEEGALTPTYARPAIAAIWRPPDDLDDFRRDCRTTSVPNWYACDFPIVWVP